MQFLHQRLKQHVPEVEDELGRAIVDLGQLAAVLIAAGVDMDTAEDVSFDDGLDVDEGDVDAEDDDEDDADAAEDGEPDIDMLGEWGRQVAFGQEFGCHQTLRWSIVKVWPSQHFVVLTIDFEPDVKDDDKFAGAQFVLRFDVRERTYSNWIEYDKLADLHQATLFSLESLLRLLEPLGVNWHYETNPRRPQLTSRSPDIVRALRTMHLAASWFVDNEEDP